MTNKIRRIDFSPDEYIAGVAGVLTAEEQGVYWMICSLIMSHGEAIEDDPKRIGRLVCLSQRKTSRIIDKLVFEQKLIKNSGKIGQKRVENELKSAQKRVENSQRNGQMGGRPPKENNNLENPEVSAAEKATTNYQLPTTNHQPPIKKKDSINGLDFDFDSWWETYPRKVGKGDAKKAFVKARKKVDQQTIIIGTQNLIQEIAKHGTELKFIKHPTKWLNGQCWSDEPTPANRASANGSKPQGSLTSAIGNVLSRLQDDPGLRIDGDGAIDITPNGRFKDGTKYIG